MLNFLCVLTLFFYCWYQFNQWGIISVEPRAQPSRYLPEFSQYFSTPWRYFAAAGSYCLTMVMLYSLILFATEWLFSAYQLEWLALAVLVFYIAVLPQLPRLGHWLDQLRYLFQRHSFTPPLPSKTEEKILAQLIHYEACFQPCQRQLSAMAPVKAAAILSESQEPRSRLLYCFAKLDFLCTQLDHHTILSRSYFYQSALLRGLEFLSSMRHHLAPIIGNINIIDQQQLAHSQLITDQLLRFCYRLLCLQAMSKNFSRETRLQAFRQFGLVLNVDNCWFLTIKQRFVALLIQLLPEYRPQLKATDHATEPSAPLERRKSKRLHYYKKAIIRFDDCVLSASSSVLSLNGLSVRGKTDKPLGSTLDLFLEGLGDLKGTLIRKNDDEICVAFMPDPHAQEKLALYLHCEATTLVSM
jgi:hypothetical protein